MMTDSYAQYTNMSGVALQLLAEQDMSRLSTAIDSTKLAVKIVAKYILRLYKQYAVIPRLLKIAGESGDIQMYYWDQNEICSDDVVFDASNNSNDNLVQRRTMLMDLIKEGLMFDEDGKFSQSMRKKCLDLLGFGMWEESIDLNALQINRAKEENLNIKEIDLMSIDDHQIHIDEHTAFLLGNEIRKKKNYKSIQETMLKHIEDHKKCLKQIEDKGE